MMVCGMDEVGRGALAGALVAAAVVLSTQREVLRLRDSKKLTPEQRNKIYKRIVRSGAVIAVEEISARQINTKGMGWANKEIFKRLARKIPADKYIADGNLKLGKKIKSVIKADTKIPEVMAASIIAKVFRDRIMDHLHEQHHEYGWQSNKGYGTKYHIAAIREHGTTKYHRKKFVETALKLPMNHVAIMNKSFGDLIFKILSGEKKIESRWSKNKIAPWGRVKRGDRIYFKNSGEPVTAVASVSKVLQFENLDPKKVKGILDRWPLVDYEWAKNKKYCVLMWLKNPKKINPFKINKSGFGSAAAWLCVQDIKKIKVG